MQTWDEEDGYLSKGHKKSWILIDKYVRAINKLYKTAPELNNRSIFWDSLNNYNNLLNMQKGYMKAKQNASSTSKFKRADHH